MKAALAAALCGLALAAHAESTAPVLTLEQAMATAKTRQPLLRQARKNAEAADARASNAFSGLLPQVSGSVGYQRATGNLIPRPGTGTATAESDTTSFNFFSDGLSVNQLIYDFGASTGRYRAAQASASSLLSTERATGLEISLNVRSTFFAARAAKSLVQVAQESLDNQKKHLSQTEEFVKSGLRPQIDVAQGRTDTANARVQLIVAENNYGLARAQLNQAIGSDSSSDFDVADDTLKPVEGEDQGTEALLAEALKARPDLVALAEQVHAQELTASAAGGTYFPSLSANVGWTQGGTEFAHMGWNVAAGVALNWQIYQGGLTKAQVREAESNAGALAAQLDLQRQQVRLEVDQARFVVRAAKEALEATQDALVNSRERLRLAESRYQTGAGSIIELGDAQVAVTQAGSQHVQADFQLAAARAQLLKALGRE